MRFYPFFFSKRMHKAALYQRSNGLQRRDAKEVLDVRFLCIFLNFLNLWNDIFRGETKKCFQISDCYYPAAVNLLFHQTFRNDSLSVIDCKMFFFVLFCFETSLKPSFN